MNCALNFLLWWLEICLCFWVKRTSSVQSLYSLVSYSQFIHRMFWKWLWQDLDSFSREKLNLNPATMRSDSKELQKLFKLLSTMFIAQFTSLKQWFMNKLVCPWNMSLILGKRLLRHYVYCSLMKYNKLTNTFLK